MPDLLVLAYHAVSEDWPTELAVMPIALEQQVRLLLRLGYHASTFSDAVLRPTSDDAFAITFDDGFASVFEHGYPVLSRLGVPATVFVPTDLVGGETPMSWPGVDHWAHTKYADEMKAISWPNLTTLAGGGWEIGSHALRHSDLTLLDDEALLGELVGSREACEKMLGLPCVSLAYPYGRYDERVLEAAVRAGYRAACTIPSEFPQPRPLEWPRVGVYRNDGLFSFRAKISPKMRRLRSSGAWDSLDRARRLLHLTPGHAHRPRPS
jgi:peptidoglycan/xylan/chitin deacetylase (PgdA/CDA1 family)